MGLCASLSNLYSPLPVQSVIHRHVCPAYRPPAKKETNDTQISCVKSLVLPYYSEVSSHSYAGDCWLNLFYYSLLTIIDFTKKSPFCQTIFSSVSRETIFLILTRNNVVAVAADIKSDTGSA